MTEPRDTTLSPPAAPATVRGRVRLWGEMIKFSHSIFALPFALMGAFLAGRQIEGLGRPRLGQIVLIVVCMVAARSTAMTFNRIADAAIDARNPRTASRPLPSGRLSPTAAWAFLALAVLTFGIGCLGFYRFYGNHWPILLSGPVLLYLYAYSYAKRFTRWSHLWLGSAIALSPVAAWVAIDPATVGRPAVTLMGAAALWIAGFDIIYACQDIEVDRRDGLHSLPARIGPAGALLVARLFHAGTVVLLVALAVVAGLGWVYLVGVAAVAVLLAVENSLVRADDFSRVNLAFFTTNGIVSVVLCALTLTDVLTDRPPLFTYPGTESRSAVS
ncbi:MAG TPA: UbiA-like polyprenyltransferase [Phycisphaerae bacterium]|nr:UbiA-like polyprenyltransferase [Phycisphaerae bacterium]